ncbi:hypothetical protein M2317_000292 [Microbacterium sp. ZKA21]|uniref:hypothetical protein n=1 Tax=Microbacterium sp. ZKA21 TaxID=3381694 RepID=UPI003D23441E
MRVRIAAVMLLSATLLTACATPANGPEQTPTSSEPAPSESASPSPSASGPDEPDPDDPSSWLVSAEGIGPVLIGGDFDATLADLPTTWTSDGAACPWAAFWNAPDTSFSMHFVRGAEDQSEPISDISASTMADSVSGPVGPETADGLGVGATRDEILAVYPDAEEGSASIDGEWIRVPSESDGQIFFQFLTGADRAWAVTVTTRDEPSYEVCG